MTIDARVILDSISPTGLRVTTLQLCFWRPMLAEANTYRQWSRNSASSRARPLKSKLQPDDPNYVPGTLDLAKADPAWPASWPCEKPGMQGGAELTGPYLEEAQGLYRDVYNATLELVETYFDSHPDMETRLHKSTINRLLEPFMWHTVVVTSTEWLNFFRQRSSYFTDLAQKDIALVADRAFEELSQSTPIELSYGEWHTPFIDDVDRAHALAEAEGVLARAVEGDHDALDSIRKHGFSTVNSDRDLLLDQLVKDTLKQLSVARCALASTMKQEVKRDLELDVKLFHRLRTADPMHSSPFEHVCTPATHEETEGHRVPGNLYGWHQLRHQYHEIKPDSIEDSAAAYARFRAEVESGSSYTDAVQKIWLAS